MIRSSEKILEAFREFTASVAEDVDSSGLRAQNLDGLDVFQLILLWRKSFGYLLRQTNIEDKLRHVVVSLDLETLVASLSVTPEGSRLEDVIAEQLLKSLAFSADMEKLNIGDLATINSFLFRRTEIIRKINDFSEERFGFSLGSEQFKAALCSHRKLVMGRRQSLAYGLFNLIIKHHPQWEEDQLWPLVEYLHKIIREKTFKPSFSEALKMWQNSPRIQQLDWVLKEFMVDEIVDIKSSTPIKELPSWFVGLLQKENELPSEVANAVADKIEDIKVFSQLKMDAFSGEVSGLSAEEKVAETTSDRLAGKDFLESFIAEIIARIRGFFGVRVENPEPAQAR
jgi:hypothetical protein